MEISTEPILAQPSEMPEGIQVVEIPAKSFGTRKVFANVDPKYRQFKKGVRVLPARNYESDPNPIYFVKEHAPGEQYFPEGGYSCVDSTSAYRAFYLDEIIIHPSEIKGKKQEIVGGKKRGRPSNPDKPSKPEPDPTAPKRGRGRPPKEDSEKKTLPYVPTGGKRGRPSIDPSLRKSKPYVPTGGKRGRPSKDKTLEDQIAKLKA